MVVKIICRLKLLFSPGEQILNNNILLCSTIYYLLVKGFLHQRSKTSRRFFYSFCANLGKCGHFVGIRSPGLVLVFPPSDVSLSLLPVSRKKLSMGRTPARKRWRNIHVMLIVYLYNISGIICSYWSAGSLIS